MARFGLLIRCVGHAVAARGLKCLMGLAPFGDQLYELAVEAYDRYRRQCQEEEALAQVQAAAQASLEEVRVEAKQVLAEIRVAASPQQAAELDQPEIERNFTAYLEQIPAAIRSTLRRPADPTGRSLPRNFSLKRAEDFLRLLPQRPPRFRPGDKVLASWVLAELLGVGGFGEVWKANHAFLASHPPVALKFCLDPDATRYLRHEARLMDRLMAKARVPGVVELKNVYLDSSPPCLAYEFVNGGDLCGLMHDWLLQPREKRFQLANQVVLRLARVIGPLHQLDRPVVHRDLKPANVLVVRKDAGKFDLKVGDFGIGGLAARRSLAAATRGVSRGDLLSQTLRGSHTPLYASAEQVRGLEPDPRDDVHALGVIWFQLLTCDLQRGVGIDFDEELHELGVSEDTIQVLKRCVTRRERRFKDCQEMAEAIASLTPATPERDRQQEEAEHRQREANNQKRLEPQRELACPPQDNLGEMQQSRQAVSQDNAEAVVSKKERRRRRREAQKREVERRQREAVEQKQREQQGRKVCSLQDKIDKQQNRQVGSQHYTKSPEGLRRAAEQGDAEAQNNLGLMYYQGDGVAGDDAEAVCWFSRAAEQGHAAAQFNLGWMYHQGRGVTQDRVVAVQWYRRAAKQGDAEAQKSLGLMYYRGNGVAQDDTKAFKWFYKAADQGDAAAQFNLGWMYHQGRGITQDNVEAVKWYRRAAEQGDAEAQKTLGLMYEQGQGVPHDNVQAVIWYRKAAEQEHPSGQFHLGRMYQHGSGVSQDDAETLRWFRRAAEQGDAEAQDNLGRMYEHGRAVPQDNTEAVSWYRKAAERGHPSGQFNLGRMYHQGRGVPQDNAEAVRWYRKAAKQGDAEAEKSLRRM